MKGETVGECKFEEKKSAKTEKEKKKKKKKALARDHNP